MNDKKSVSEIASQFRQGQDENFYFSEVIPLFSPGAAIFEKFNSDLKKTFTSAFTECGASPDESDFRCKGFVKLSQKELIPN